MVGVGNTVDNDVFYDVNLEFTDMQKDGAEQKGLGNNPIPHIKNASAPSFDTTIPQAAPNVKHLYTNKANATQPSLGYERGLNDARRSAAEASLAEYQQKLSELEQMSAAELYRNTAGEIEARDAASRIDMTAEERRNNFPEAFKQRDGVVFADGGVSYDIDNGFETRYDKWVKDGRPDRETITVGTTSDALKSIDVKDQKITWDTSKINEALRKHNELDDNILKQIPQVLENPIIVMQSLQSDSRLTMFGEVYDNNGIPVMAVLELLPTNRNATIVLDEIKLTSTYGKDNTQSFINRSDILYLDPNKKGPIVG